jgi:hypothetical protein
VLIWTRRPSTFPTPMSWPAFMSWFLLDKFGGAVGTPTDTHRIVCSYLRLYVHYDERD